MSTLNKPWWAFPCRKATQYVSGALSSFPSTARQKPPFSSNISFLPESPQSFPFLWEDCGCVKVYISKHKETPAHSLGRALPSSASLVLSSHRPYFCSILKHPDSSPKPVKAPLPALMQWVMTTTSGRSSHSIEEVLVVHYILLKRPISSHVH